MHRAFRCLHAEGATEEHPYLARKVELLVAGVSPELERAFSAPRTARIGRVDMALVYMPAKGSEGPRVLIALRPLPPRPEIPIR